ncbi:MAG: 50S ribosomal protein L3 [Dehalococcoidia bacterium]|nr:50S ribosomal protein L3 [Dehalococcoidia bacterium]
MLNGILGKKLGMTQVFSEAGSPMTVTVVEAGPCVVIQVKTMDVDGYQAVQVGFGHKKRLNKPEQGHLRGQGTFRYLREFRVEDASKFQVGQKVQADIFAAGDKVDVTGTSRGMGFQGGVKRYHFHGGPKTHGQSDRHRAPGSVGSTTTPGRVLKGLRMAGHMGNVRVTTQNLRIIRVEPERNLLLLEGAVPGAKNGLVEVRHARKGAKAKAKA